jgi:hypothetical protein
MVLWSWIVQQGLATPLLAVATFVLFALVGWALFRHLPVLANGLLVIADHQSGAEGTLERATARALYRLLVPLYQLVIDERDRAYEELHQVQIRELAGQLYALLPSLVTIRLGRLAVPVPLKSIVTQEQFIQFMVVAVTDLQSGLDALTNEVTKAFQEAQQRGIDRAALLAGAHRIDSEPE